MSIQRKHHPSNCALKGMYGRDCSDCDPTVPPNNKVQRKATKISEIAMLALAALVSDDRLVVVALRSTPDGEDWRAEVSPRGNVARFTVPIPTFRKMVRDGLLVKDREWQVSDKGLTHSEYVLTDAGREAVANSHIKY